MPAAKAGLQADDLVTGIDGKPSRARGRSCPRAIRGSGGAAVTLDVQRGDEAIQLRGDARGAAGEEHLRRGDRHTYLIGIERGFELVSGRPDRGDRQRRRADSLVVSARSS